MKVSIEEKPDLSGIYFIDSDGDVFVRDYYAVGKFIVIASECEVRVGDKFHKDDLEDLRPFIGKITINTTGDV